MFLGAPSTHPDMYLVFFTKSLQKFILRHNDWHFWSLTSYCCRRSSSQLLSTYAKKSDKKVSCNPESNGRNPVGIRNPMLGIRNSSKAWNPESTVGDLESTGRDSGIHLWESRILLSESGIRQYIGFLYIGRLLLKLHIGNKDYL